MLISFFRNVFIALTVFQSKPTNKRKLRLKAGMINFQFTSIRQCYELKSTEIQMNTVFINDAHAQVCFLFPYDFEYILINLSQVKMNIIDRLLCITISSNELLRQVVENQRENTKLTN